MKFNVLSLSLLFFFMCMKVRETGLFGSCLEHLPPCPGPKICLLLSEQVQILSIKSLPVLLCVILLIKILILFCFIFFYLAINKTLTCSDIYEKVKVPLLTKIHSNMPWTDSRHFQTNTHILMLKMISSILIYATSKCTCL